MNIKFLAAARARTSANEINSSKMPSGRYGFTITSVVYSDKETDLALYVNYDVHGDNCKKSMSIRCEPQLSDDNVNFSRNYAGIASIKQLLEAAKPGSSNAFNSQVAAAVIAEQLKQDDALGVALFACYNIANSLTGINFTAHFEWAVSKKNGKSYFNLRSTKGNKDQVISLDHVREPVNENDAEQERQPKGKTYSQPSRK
jgi:hypothetical protein